MCDLTSGIIEDPNQQELTNDQKYANYLSKKLDNAIDVDVIMSVQNPKLQYLELMVSTSISFTSETSHYSYWSFCTKLVSGTDDPATKLKEIKGIYEDELIVIGSSSQIKNTLKKDF